MSDKREERVRWDVVHGFVRGVGIESPHNTEELARASIKFLRKCGQKPILVRVTEHREVVEVGDV